MVGHSEDLIRATHFQAAILKKFKGMVGTILNEVPPDMQQRLTIIALQNPMVRDLRFIISAMSIAS